MNCLNKKNSFLLICLCLFYTSFLCADPTYKIWNLGTLQSDESAAYAINNKGEVAGTYKLQGKNYAFIWNQLKGLTLIDLPQTAIPKKINKGIRLIIQYLNYSLLRFI
jgi:hypothetical protein